MSDELRKQFELETGAPWKNSQGEPDIEYVEWLERRQEAADWNRDASAYMSGVLDERRSRQKAKPLTLDQIEDLIVHALYRYSSPGCELPLKTCISEAIIAAMPPDRSARIAELEAEFAKLNDGNSVWANILCGTIGKPPAIASMGNRIAELERVIEWQKKEIAELQAINDSNRDMIIAGRDSVDEINEYRDALEGILAIGKNLSFSAKEIASSVLEKYK